MSAPTRDDVQNIPVKEEPPPSRAGRGSIVSQFEPMLDHLMKDPGEWYRLREYESPSSAYSARKSMTKAKDEVSPGKWVFEARTLKVGDKDVGRLYGKFIG